MERPKITTVHQVTVPSALACPMFALITEALTKPRKKLATIKVTKRISIATSTCGMYISTVPRKAERAAKPRISEAASVKTKMKNQYTTLPRKTPASSFILARCTKVSTTINLYISTGFLDLCYIYDYNINSFCRRDGTVWIIQARL